MLLWLPAGLLMFAYPHDQFQPARPPLAGEIALSEIQNVLLRKGLALWEAACGACAFPSRHEMGPRALGPLLRNTALIKVLDGGAEFQVRIIGDAIMAAQGDPMQGMTTAEIDDQLPGYGALLHRIYSQVHADRAPLAFAGEFRRKADGKVFDHEHLLLPLGGSGDAVDHLLSMVVYSFALS